LCGKKKKKKKNNKNPHSNSPSRGCARVLHAALSYQKNRIAPLKRILIPPPPTHTLYPHYDIFIFPTFIVQNVVIDANIGHIMKN
jgi:hypothetical protein